MRPTRNLTKALLPKENKIYKADGCKLHLAVRFIFAYLKRISAKKLQKPIVLCVIIPIFATNKNKYAIMKVKNSRLDAIRLILSTQEIGSQEELLSELEKEGFKLTQATLSRDLHQLRVVKSVGVQGRYRYILTRPHQYRHEGEQGEVRPLTTPQEATGFLSIKFSGNIAVIHTKPSYASTLAYHIDNYDFPEIIGTIAGDDTVMLIIAEEANRTMVLRALRTIIPNI